MQTARLRETHRRDEICASRPSYQHRHAKAARRPTIRRTAGQAKERAMFGSTEAFSGFAVDDMDKARAFYGETLGIETSTENGLMTMHLAGDRPTLVYPKPDHSPAAYTILNFRVDDIEQAVDELAARGVTLERYDGFEQDERGIFRGGGPFIGWFKDPAGNVLAVLQER
jgi:catechol 2,3-dioxygenase-like lactoylglutathione lyase family enzyme